MNKRQKKKQYKKLIGRNPPKWLKFTTECFCSIIGKPYGGRRPYQQEDGLTVFIRTLSERRKHIGNRKRSRKTQRNLAVHNKLHKTTWVRAELPRNWNGSRLKINK